MAVASALRGAFNSHMHENQVAFILFVIKKSELYTPNYGLYLLRRLESPVNKKRNMQVHLAFSPTHTRTEERAPMWGSEFTTKAAKLQGVQQNSCHGLNGKFCDLPACVLLRASRLPA
jgi:hypothetical protein